MSMAEREAKWAMRCTRWAGQSRLVQKVSLSPGSRTSGAPQLGHTVGNFHRSTAAALVGAEHRSHHLGDHVAGLAHHHRVAGPHVLGPHLVLVVEGGQRHGGAPHEHRLQHGEGGGLAGAADGDGDAEQRGALLGGELVGDGPPGRPRRGAELALEARSSTLITTPSIS
jgi:hypothetical protein